MKKQIYTLFKNNPYLLDEPEVTELINYCEHLQDELNNLKFEQDKNKQTLLLEMLSEILDSCNKIQKEQEEHLRFGYPLAEFEQAISKLKSYILVRCKDEKIYL